MSDYAPFLAAHTTHKPFPLSFDIRDNPEGGEGSALRGLFLSHLFGIWNQWGNPMCKLCVPRGEVLGPPLYLPESTLDGL